MVVVVVECVCVYVWGGGGDETLREAKNRLDVVCCLRFVDVSASVRLDSMCNVSNPIKMGMCHVVTTAKNVNYVRYFQQGSNRWWSTDGLFFVQVQ